jgi:hypothetical protein
MLATGAAAPAMAKDVVLRNQLAPIDGELVWCDLMIYDEDDDEIEVCIPHDDGDDDGDGDDDHE